MMKATEYAEKIISTLEGLDGETAETAITLAQTLVGHKIRTDGFSSSNQTSVQEESHSGPPQYPVGTGRSSQDS